MRFVWDERKRKSNLRKHGFDFRDASALFRDGFLFTEDTRKDYGEARYIGLNELPGENVVVAVVFTSPDEGTVRVISMRAADDLECEVYYGQ